MTTLPKSCPFCGGNARIRRTDSDNYQVLCQKCHARGPTAVTEDEAKDRWRSVGGGW